MELMDDAKKSANQVSDDAAAAASDASDQVNKARDAVTEAAAEPVRLRKMQ